MAFVCGFAENVFRESMVKVKDHQKFDDVVVPVKENEKVTDNSGSCLDKCLTALSTENRDLILDYFSEQKQAKIDLHKKTAVSLEMTQTTVRMRVTTPKTKTSQPCKHPASSATVS